MRHNVTFYILQQPRHKYFRAMSILLSNVYSNNQSLAFLKKLRKETLSQFQLAERFDILP